MNNIVYYLYHIFLEGKEAKVYYTETNPQEFIVKSVEYELVEYSEDRLYIYDIYEPEPE